MLPGSGLEEDHGSRTTDHISKGTQDKRSGAGKMRAASFLSSDSSSGLVSPPRTPGTISRPHQLLSLLVLLAIAVVCGQARAEGVESSSHSQSQSQSQAPPVNVKLRAPWEKTPLLVEIL